jgi:hypothetical protein
METFYNNLDTKVPVWCISHAGHYDLPGVLPLKGENMKLNMYNIQVLFVVE